MRRHFGDFPIKISPLHGGSGLPSNTWLLGALKFTSQTTRRSVKPLCRAHNHEMMTDRSTDRATPSVATGHIYVVLQCSLIIQIPDLNPEFIPCQRHIWPHVDASCFWNVLICLLHPGSIRYLSSLLG